MREHTLHTEQTLSAPLDRVFAFFANAENLEAITPPFLKFHITTPTPIAMHPGTEIAYDLSLHGIRFNWASRITVWEPGVRFVDEQLKGPYRRWIHEHSFAPAPGNPNHTVVTDHVRYVVPGGIFQAPIHRLLVRPQLDRIFAHRAQATKRLIESPQVGPAR
ncbi:MAG: SRPBCC family protein [Phycisphaerales bacterium]